jgi:hypothetical protein
LLFSTAPTAMPIWAGLRNAAAASQPDLARFPQSVQLVMVCVGLLHP